MKFTKEEISLCRQVAKKHRKDIKYGDWYWSKSYNKPLLAMDYGFKIKEQEWSQVFKIWTISDCLEFLDKHTNDWSLDKDVDEEGKQTGKFCLWWMPSPKHKDSYRIGETRLEACLKAVLAVLEEEEK